VEVRVDLYTPAARLAEPESTVGVERLRPRFGDLAAVRLLGRGLLEDREGRVVEVEAGTVVVGAFGRKMSTRDYVGVVPEEPLEELHILTFGGVIGLCIDRSHLLREPVKAVYLGTVVEGDEPLNTADLASVKPSRKVEFNGPVVMVVGTGPETGKTTAAASIIRALSHLKVAGLKATGVAAMRDLKAMSEAGASPVYDFVDAGLPSTYVPSDVLIPAVKGLLNACSGAGCVVCELGGSVVGYGSVLHVLSDRDVMSSVSSIVLSAGDVVSAWGGVEFLRRHLNLEVSLVSGPATDTSVGRRMVERLTGVEAFNLTSGCPTRLAERLLEGAVQTPKPSPELRSMLSEPRWKNFR